MAYFGSSYVMRAAAGLLIGIYMLEYREFAEAYPGFFELIQSAYFVLTDVVPVFAPPFTAAPTFDAVAVSLTEDAIPGHQPVIANPPATAINANAPTVAAVRAPQRHVAVRARPGRRGQAPA